jgi:hypothetical protein
MKPMLGLTAELILKSSPSAPRPPAGDGGAAAAIADFVRGDQPGGGSSGWLPSLKHVDSKT